jgi:hypothetical protein
LGNKKDPKDDLVAAEEIENDLLELFGIENWEDLTLQEEGPDFDCAGGKEAFFLYPKTAIANIWISENLGVPFGDWPSEIQIAEEDVLKAIKTIFEDGLNFSKTLH